MTIASVPDGTLCIVDFSIARSRRFSRFRFVASFDTLLLTMTPNRGGREESRLRYLKMIDWVLNVFWS
jgi:hypothetical protein